MKPNVNFVSLRISAGQAEQFPRDALPQIAFSGRSNVGKSSLINTLLGRSSLARVSGTPGKTITVNFYDIDRQLFFVDLPGYGFARRSARDKEKWSDLTDAYFTRNPNRDLLSLVVQLIDIRIGPTDDDRMMLSWLSHTGIPYVVVATKCDKLSAPVLAELVTRYRREIGKDITFIPFSSVSKLGKEELWTSILSEVQK